MMIKDIVNPGIVNLTNCELEPIHIPGSIQPYGFLVAVQEDSLLIEYCSANIVDFIGVSYEQCLGKNFADIFSTEMETILVKHFAKPVNALNPPYTVKVNKVDLLCSVHKSGGCLVAEFEPADQNAPEVTTVYNQTIKFVNYMEEVNTLQELCGKVAEQTRMITGYDRVMIYRFDKDYNGEVIAESRADTAEPFLGLHYPHTDIPAQARQLYLTNLMRIIVDISYQPVPIYTIDDSENKNLNLSSSGLRSVSPIHIQYLKNMGVSGTFTISYGGL
jgi:chemotaxis family two-component system sensor kinase Cph1